MGLNERDFRRLKLACLIAGLSGLALLYSIGLIPGVQSWLARNEVRVFDALSGLLGRNPVWDWSLLVTSSKFWVFTAYTLSFVVFAWDGWRIRKKDYGKIYGYLLFAAAVVLLTEEVADFIADHIHRALPWKDGMIAQIAKSYDADFFRARRSEGIVDDTASALFCFVCLSVVHSRRTAAVALVLLLTYSFSSIAVGTQWLTVQIASAFMGAVFAGASLMLTQGLRGYLEKKASSFFVAFFGALLLRRGIIDRHREDPADQLVKAARQIARAMRGASEERFWSSFVKPRAVALLGADPKRADFFVPPEIRTRSAERVRFLDTGRGEVFVVRAMRRPGGILRTPPKLARFSEGVKNNVLLHRLGFAVPGVLWTEEGLTTMGLRSYFLAIEERLDVRPLDASSASEVRGAMQVLAGLHNNKSSEWGAAFRTSTGSRTDFILEFLRGDVLYYLKRLDDHYGVLFDSKEIEDIWRSYQELAESLFCEATGSFRLIHGDASPRNLCVGTRDGRIHLIDFTTVRYDLAGWEIIKAAISLTRLEPAHCRLAWEAYFEAAGETRWGEFLGESRLAFARFALRELAHKRVHFHGCSRKGPGDKQQFRSWLAGLFAVDDSLWGATPQDTRWEDIFALLGIHEREGSSEA